MKTFLAFSCLLLLLSVGVAEAQVVIPDQDHPTQLGRTVYGLGFAGGPATGLGLSFRYHMPSAFSYQIVGGVIKVDTKLMYDIGGEAQFDLVRGDETRFFAAGGVGYYYSRDSRSNDLKGPFRVGLGIGGEFSHIQVLHITVEGMFVLFSDGTILPLPQLSLHYYFF